MIVKFKNDKGQKVKKEQAPAKAALANGAKTPLIEHIQRLRLEMEEKRKYERTIDITRMLTSAQLDKAICEDAKTKNILDLMPARTSTFISYKAGEEKAVVWNQASGDCKAMTICLPLYEGYYVPDGNSFAIPNGKPSDRNDPEARYLARIDARTASYQPSEYRGPVGRQYWDNGNGEHYINLYESKKFAHGVALIDSRRATAPLFRVPDEDLAKITDLEALMDRAQQLQDSAYELDGVSPEAWDRLAKPFLDEATFLWKLVKKLRQSSIAAE